MGTFYENPRMYIQAATDIKTKIERLDAIITALEDAALAAASGQDVSEYNLDDGQTKIRAVSRDAVSIANSIEAFERIRMRYVNRYNGHVFVLKDERAVGNKRMV